MFAGYLSMQAEPEDREGLLHDLEGWLERLMEVLSGVWLVLLVIELGWSRSSELRAELATLRQELRRGGLAAQAG